MTHDLFGPKGDLVLDGFCGSGMACVAQWCGSAPPDYCRQLKKSFVLKRSVPASNRAWQERDYISTKWLAEKLLWLVLHEDQKPLMWYEQTQTWQGEQSFF
jgi:hypothetical protein